MNKIETKIEEKKDINRGFYRRLIKRPMDFILSLIAIIFLSPILLIVAFLVRIKLGSPVIFKQERVGLKEKIFTIYKFRTMTDKKDENGELLPDNVRLSKFGRFLRSTSLDELPELFNILKGDMSIVGPRPLPEIYLQYYSETEKLRHTVKSGLTGKAQINGRNMLRWEEKFDYDLRYISNITFMEDCKIILLTILKVLGKYDVVSNDVVIIDGCESRPLHIERSSKLEGE